MLVEFNKLPETARIWIYQANRSFTEEETEEIKEKTAAFLEQWTAHGTNLKAGFEVPYRRFLVIGLDQEINAASGCSIDTSIKFIQQLEKDYNVDLLDKMNVSFKNGEYVAYKPLLDFKKMVKQGAVSANTVVFNNLVVDKKAYERDWEVPMKESWHSRFL